MKMAAVLALSAIVLWSSVEFAAPQELSGLSRGAANLVLPAVANRVRLLSGFYFGFKQADWDHPMKIVAVRLAADGAHGRLQFEDRDPTNDDDTYNYQTKWTAVPSEGVIVGSLHQLAVGNYDLSVPHMDDAVFRSQHVFVLTGFSLAYADDDYAIKKIAIVSNSDKVSVDFHDRGGLNKFTVDVDYALVPRSMIAQVQTIQAEAAKSLTSPILAGAAVISGFSFEYLDDDFKIHELGVFPRVDSHQESVFTLLFNDLSGQRRFRYRVDYSILK
jgi:hypothetical protein